MFLSAVCQITSTSDEAHNYEQVEELIARAARYGASLITTPEATNYLGPHAKKVAMAESLDGPVSRRFSGLAKSHGVHLLLGSFNEASDEPSRCHNTAVLYGPDGAILGVYRKIHLFDIDSEEVRFLESETCKPGVQPTVVDTALGKIGLTICYDLRFPEIYRWLVDNGAEIIAVPAAFTRPTGQAHWHTLLRTRAIETQTWVIAPGQYGNHDDGGLKESYGHSMIIDPWGSIVCEVSDGIGLGLAEIDLDRARRIRRSMPLREHRRI
ncbi:MAG: putative amidohydrolase [Kiritimatiellia bacterium]|jgi:predicted amidohydrolase